MIEKKKSSAKNNRASANKATIIYAENEHSVYARMLVDIIGDDLSLANSYKSVYAQVDMALLAWNMSVAEIIDPENFDSLFQQAIFIVDYDDEQTELAERFMDRKQAKYESFHEVILDFDLDVNLSGDIEIIVETAPYEHLSDRDN